MSDAMAYHSAVSGVGPRCITGRMVWEKLLHHASALERTDRTTTDSGNAWCSSFHTAAAGQSTAAENPSSMGAHSGGLPKMAPCHSGTCSGRGKSSTMW